ncbi:putative ribonuclease H-like domain-containing protein [Tanacetum coccineum]|uniref:Ribonuclease H-like domain-containing protein n=1 Tax=Tanacetum coccineum TaxID=301880 RepID=A0ABQ5B7L9_9ASTR
MPHYKLGILLRECKFKVSKEGGRQEAVEADFKPDKLDHLPHSPIPTVSMLAPFDGELGTVTDLSVNDDSIPIPSSEQVSISTQKTQSQVPTPPQTVDPSCAQHVKTPRQPIRTPVTPPHTNSFHIKDRIGNQKMERELGSGYLLKENPCFDHPLKHMEHRGIFDSGCSGHKKNHDLVTIALLKITRSIPNGICYFCRKFSFLNLPRQHNMYTFDMKNVASSKGYTCLLAKASSNEAKLWHRRLGHLNFKNLNKLVKDNLVRGLPSKSFKNDHTCVACQKGKQHKASCKAKIDRKLPHPLHTLHMDLFGPTSVRSINHASYCLVITDDCSRYALTANPTIYDSLVKQFWQSAVASTREDGSLKISATVDTKRYIISEASIRDSLQLDDATRISMLPNDDLFEGQEHAAQAQTQPIPPPPPIPSKNNQQPIPQTSIHLHLHLSSTTPTPILHLHQHHRTIPAPTSPPPPPPETVHSNRVSNLCGANSPVHHHFSPSQAQAPSHMPIDDLASNIPKTPGSREKSQADTSESSKTRLVTPPTTKAHASGRNKRKIIPNTLEAAKTLSKVFLFKSQGHVDKGRRYKRKKRFYRPHPHALFKKESLKLGLFHEDNTGAEKINTAGEVNAAGIEVNTDEGEIAPMLSEETPKKTKEQILQEEASLAEAIRLDSLQREEEAEQIHLDALLAQRIAEEEELTEQQKKRKAQSMLGSELQGEDFAKKMVDFVNQRKKFFAEERAKAKRNKPMTQSQLKTYMMNYLKNQGSWKLNQLRKLSFEEVKEEFDKLIKQIDSFAPISFEATKDSLKRFGEELQTKTPKRLKEDKDDEAKVDECQPKKLTKEKKQISIIGTETPLNPVPSEL